jgi:hypothetical protein
MSLVLAQPCLRPGIISENLPRTKTKFCLSLCPPFSRLPVFHCTLNLTRIRKIIKSSGTQAPVVARLARDAVIGAQDSLANV